MYDQASRVMSSVSFCAADFSYRAPFSTRQAVMLCCNAAFRTPLVDANCVGRSIGAALDLQSHRTYFSCSKPKTSAEVLTKAERNERAPIPQNVSPLRRFSTPLALKTGPLAYTEAQCHE